MPEAHPEENLQRAEILLKGTNDEVLQACLPILIYNLSNNLSDLSEDRTWHTAIEILRHCGILNLRVNLKGLNNATVDGFMGNLFRATIYRLTNTKSATTDAQEAFVVLKWLLSSNQSPHISLVMPGAFRATTTPLQAAIRSGNLELMECLLRSGADANLIPSSSQSDSPLEFVPKMHSLGSHVVSRMAHILLQHGVVRNLEQALNSAILRQDMALAGAILERGANICGSFTSLSGFIYNESALSAMVKNLLEKGAKLIRGEVISAIFVGDWHLVEILLDHGGTLMDTKYCGITAMETTLSFKDTFGLSKVLAAYPDVYDPSSLCAAVASGNNPIVDKLLADRPRQIEKSLLEGAAVGLASQIGDLNLLRRLLLTLPHTDKGNLPLVINHKGDLLPIQRTRFWWRSAACLQGSPVVMAALSGSTAAVTELLEKGFGADRLTWAVVTDANDLSMAQVLADNNQRLDNES